PPVCVRKVSAHRPRSRGQVGPIAEAPQVSAVAQADHRDARLRGLRDADARRLLAYHLSEAAIAVDDRERVRIENDGRRLVRTQTAVAYPFEIFRHAPHAVANSAV